MCYRFVAFVATSRINVEGARKFDPFRRKVIYLWRFVVVDPAAIEEEAQRGDRDTHLKGGDIVVVFLLRAASYPLTIALLQLAHLGGLLHPEVDLVAVLPHHLQLDVLGLVAGHGGPSDL